MKGNASNIQVKQLNRNRVFRYINSREKTSMPEIAMALHISTPTVLSIVNELEKRQMVEVNGEFESTGGRKAKILTAVRNSRYAVGLDITANHVSITYTDLSGRALNHRRIRKPLSIRMIILRS